MKIGSESELDKSYGRGAENKPANIVWGKTTNIIQLEVFLVRPSDNLPPSTDNGQSNLSVTEKEKKKDSAWSILVVGYDKGRHKTGNLLPNFYEMISNPKYVIVCKQCFTPSPI